MGSAIPLCRWPFPRLCGFPSEGWPGAFQRPVKSPLVEFRLPPEYYPVGPSRSAAAGQLLSWAFGPFSTCRNRRSTDRELAGLTRLRLQGLVTLLTVYSLRFLDGSVSHRQHSWDLPFGAVLSTGIRSVSVRINPPTVSPAVVSLCRSTGPARQAAVPGF
jgi:hypothetical protein